ncbi:MAG TPA: ABC transporter ATP-binding protein [Patescibacteria group bacterium]|nr:ABC transporter ATP-binding protein [Patescibacteria group bacterium]
MAACIQLVELSKNYAALRAVDRLSLEVNSGEIFGLVGPDGAGKTSVIRMITGVLEPSAGQITVLGENSLERIKSSLGYVPQKFSLYGDLTVWENIRLLGSLYGASPAQIETAATEILTFTNLLTFKDRLADNLSGGMKQKLALAAGLMHKPKIFFLDEPTTGVDPVSRREFWQMLYGLNKEGMTIFVSTPYMDEAELCSRIAFLHNGHLVACSSPAELKANYPYRLLELKSVGKDLRQHLACEEVHDINSFGDTYHLAVTQPEAAALAVRSALADAGVPILSLQEIPPTLEDVFVALAEEGDKT